MSREEEEEEEEEEDNDDDDDIGTVFSIIMSPICEARLQSRDETASWYGRSISTRPIE